MKYRHQGLGKQHLEDRKRTEISILSYIRKNQPVCTNEIIKGTGHDNKVTSNALQRLSEAKKIKQVRDPKGRKNTKCYASWNYRYIFSKSQLEKNPLFSLKHFLGMKTISPKLQLFQLGLAATFNELLDKGYFDQIERFSYEYELEAKRKLNQRKKSKVVSLLSLFNTVILSETIYTKRKACSIYGITPKNLDENIKRYPYLQELRYYIRKLVSKAEKSSKKVFPVPDKHGRIRSLHLVKTKEAKKYGLI